MARLPFDSNKDTSKYLVMHEMHDQSVHNDSKNGKMNLLQLQQSCGHADDAPIQQDDEEPFEEEKYEDYSDFCSPEAHAEGCLTHKDNNSLDCAVQSNKENEDSQKDLTCDGTIGQSRDEQSFRARDLLLKCKKYEDSIDRQSSASSLDARSSASSPGKLSLREKLQHRLKKRHELRLKQIREELEKSRVNHDSPSNFSDDILTTWTSETEPTSPMSDSGLSTPVDHHHAAHNLTLDNRADDASNISLYRLSRTVRYGRRGEMPQPLEHGNVIRLHIYDLIKNDTVMQLPFGCEFPIGKCFQTMNNGLHALGTGAYHCGLEVNGIEYAYGANDIADATGVFTCVPKHSPGYQHRTSIDFGRRFVRKKAWVNIQTELVNTRTGKGTKISDVYEEVTRFLDGHEILQSMAPEYRGTDYDLLEKNCCTFARDACLRLGIKEHEIPTWFMNLASAGAMTREAAQRTLSAFALPQSITSRSEKESSHALNDGGIEVILEKDSSRNGEIVKVVDTLGESNSKRSLEETIGVRRTLSWTY